MDNIYLICVDPAKGHNKYWEAAISGSRVWVHYGGIGTKGTIQIKEFSSGTQSRSFIEKKVNEKIGKGYHKAERPARMPDLSEVFGVSEEDGAEPSEPPEKYYLAWGTLGEITEEQMKEAGDITSRIAAAIAQDIPELQPSVFWHQEENTPGYIELSCDEVVNFGFPPTSFLESLNEKERLAVLNNGTSRDGWLSARGTGQGTVVTGKGNIDFLVRLFLSVLMGKAELEVFSSQDEELKAQFCAPEDPETFEWCNHLAAIQAIVGQYWLIEGQAAIISPESKSAYAW